MKQYGLTIVRIGLCTVLLSAWVMGQTRSGKLGVGIDATGQYVLGAGSPSSGVGPGGGISLFYSPWNYIGLRSNILYNQLSWTTVKTPSGNKSVTTDMMSMNFYLSLDLAPNSTFNPFIFAGGGIANFDPKDEYTGYRAFGPTNFDTQYGGGFGFDIFFNEFWSVTVMGEYVLTGSKNYAGSNSASDFDSNNISKLTGNDSFARVSFQIRYYFFDQGFIAKLLKTQRDKLNSGN